MSQPPDITEAIPFHLGRAALGAAFTQTGAKYDVSIGGLPFLVAPSDEFPYSRTTIDGVKQQLDTSTAAGEQSLSQWWIRSQDSWHRGAGITFYEPTSDQLTRFRFDEAVGVDVWETGRVTLLRKMTIPSGLSVTSGQYAGAAGAVVGGVNFIYTLLNGQLKKYDGTTVTDYTGESSASTGPCVAGTKVVVGTTTGTQIGDLTGTTVAADATGATTTVTPYWVKSRLVLAHGNKLTETTPGAAVNLGAATPMVTHPDANWVWSCVSEASSAILASGYSNGVSAIYAFTLDVTGTAGGTPTLNQGRVVAEFPPGEEVYAIKGYLGVYLAIGTTKGVRIGVVDSNGDIQYGPLIVETTRAVRSFAARDSFVFAAVDREIDGGSGLARIDLGEEISDLRFAWSWDVQTHTTGVPHSAAFFGVGDRPVLAVTGEGVYVQSATVYEDSGYVTSGSIRFSTREPKSFDRMKIRALIPTGTSIQIATIEAGAGAENLFSVDSGFDTNEDITLATVTGLQEYIALRMTLNSEAATHLLTPTLQSFQVNALPQPSVQRRIVLPLMCFDREEDRNGVSVGMTGGAWARLSALEEYENDSAVVNIQDFRIGESFAARIDEVRFLNVQPPTKNKSNFGGRLIVTVTML